MTVGKHTPGPWIVAEIEEGCPYIIAEQGRKWNNPTICNLYRDATPEDAVTIGDWNEPEENAKANAQLIATAPEMLDVLIRLKHIADTAYNVFYKLDKEEALRFKADAKLAHDVIVKATTV